METLLEVSGISKSFGGVHVLNDISISVESGETVGLIGPNGAGKTTLFNVISGFLPLDKGLVTLKDRDITNCPPYKRAQLGIYRTFQRVRIAGKMRVLDNLFLALQDRHYERAWSAIGLAGLWMKQEGLWRSRALEILSEIGLKEKQDVMAEELSYGQQKLLSLGMGMAAEAHLLLLDEPLAGLSPTMVAKAVALLQKIADGQKGILIIEHNIPLLEQICDRIIFIAQGRNICEGSLRELRDNPDVVRLYLGGLKIAK